jgi:uncharacterized protein (DUF1697 family)
MARVALLRGINLGSSRHVPMDEVATLARDLGWRRVSTYLRSGNLLFTADGAASDLADALRARLAAAFSIEVDVVIRTRAELVRLLADYPFGPADRSRQVIACCTGEIGAGAAQRLASLAAPGERVQVQGCDIFADFPDGQASSKLAAGLLAAVRPVTGTARNLNTLTKLVELLGAAEATG